MRGDFFERLAASFARAAASAAEALASARAVTRSLADALAPADHPVATYLPADLLEALHVEAAAAGTDFSGALRQALAAARAARELPVRWRALANDFCHDDGAAMAATLRDCARELEEWMVASFANDGDVEVGE